MYFQDLSTYCYAVDAPLNDVKMVGWLAAHHAYTTGDVTVDLIKKLTQLSFVNSVRPMRGYHYCEFCDEEEITVEWNGRKMRLGMSEIWVPSPGYTVIYAAPELIVHYIQKHNYRPPAQFISSVADYDFSCEWNAEEVCRSILCKR